MITSFKIFESNEIDIDDILDNYLRAVLFTDDRNSMVDKDVDNFSEDSVEEAKREINWFINTAKKIKPDIFDNIFREGGSNESVGYDIWFTRNGHGVGFWDRGYDDDDAKILTDLSKVLGEATAWLNEDDEELVDIETYENYRKFNVQEYLINRDIKKFNL